MLFLQRIPKLLRWILSVVLFFLIIMTISRFLIYWKFNPPGKAFSGSAFLLGFRFDARVTAIIGLGMMLLCAIPALNPFKNYKAKRFWNIFLPVVFFIVVLVYAIDFYHFDYLHQRLNATVLNYLEDAGISFSMMWESYPLLAITIGLILLFMVAWFIFGRLLARFQHEDSFYKRRGVLFYILTFFVFAVFIFGRIGQFPLRWSDAYTLSDDFKANLALNPFQSFISTLNFRNSTYDIKKVRAAYPLMASCLGIEKPDGQLLNFERNYTKNDTVGTKPNIVLVICESFSAYKSSMYNNPLNTTPYFNELCKNGIFFDRCFTPAYGTARGVWATITGIPDVESPKTASRNPNAVDQHTIINDFGYNNFYFLGGSATWANIRGVLTNNINNLKLYEQDDYKAEKIDVWGISDKNLFLEANKVLKQQKDPFFAIIQTADNHRPYTIPSEDKDEFKLTYFSDDSLKRFGFESNDEMNAFRYTDFGFQKFMEAANKEPYFANTIFVFVGDHGIRGNAGDIFPRSWTEQGLTCEHVPLLFYAPGSLKPKRVHDISSQVDIMPSIAWLAKIPYSNNTLGRNLFDTVKNNKYAFIIDHDVKTIGMISNEYYYLKNTKTGKDDLVSITGNEKVPVTEKTDSVKRHLQQLTDAWHETSKYLLLNNKKKQ
ncbi:MAG TPA: sulfatase-like hydrolase/transferase [Ferruginibacter sp.]|nr:sulfatase-like hydrolase/transferase [Ferruginibacter sp.]